MVNNKIIQYKPISIITINLIIAIVGIIVKSQHSLLPEILLPILYGTGTGSEVMSRIAAPMVGGMVSAVVLTLLVLPALYYLWRTSHIESSLEIKD